jgi:hypothetical protein
LVGEMRRLSTGPTTIQWSPVGCSATISHSREAERVREQRYAGASGFPVEAGESLGAAWVARATKSSCCRPSTFTPKRLVRRMRDHVSESRDGQNETRGGSSETAVSELTIYPAGGPDVELPHSSRPYLPRLGSSR